MRRRIERNVLSEPKSLDDVALSADECLLRLHLAIWPQQQWVIDQELVPRMRTMMKSEGFEVLNDEIVVFYHPSETRSLSRKKRRDRVRG